MCEEREEQATVAGPFDRPHAEDRPVYPGAAQEGEGGGHQPEADRSESWHRTMCSWHKTETGGHKSNVGYVWKFSILSIIMHVVSNSPYKIYGIKDETSLNVGKHPTTLPAVLIHLNDFLCIP